MKRNTTARQCHADEGFNRRRSRQWTFAHLVNTLSIVVALYALSTAAFAQATLDIAQVSAPAGAIVFLPLYYAAPDEVAPATLVMQVSSPALAFEKPGALATPFLAENGKMLDCEPGNYSVSLAIFGGANPIPTGTLCHLLLRVSPEAQPGNTFPIHSEAVHGADSAAAYTTVQTHSGAVLIMDAPRKHSADTSEDWSISLPELIHVIDLYKANEYHCEDSDYAPGVGDRSCAPHDADYSPQDWRVNLSELLRVIQMHNAPYGVYHVKQGSEDGFAPGPFGY